MSEVDIPWHTTGETNLPSNSDEMIQHALREVAEENDWRAAVTLVADDGGSIDMTVCPEEFWPLLKDGSSKFPDGHSITGRILSLYGPGPYALTITGYIWNTLTGHIDTHRSSSSPILSFLYRFIYGFETTSFFRYAPSLTLRFHYMDSMDCESTKSWQRSTRCEKSSIVASQFWTLSKSHCHRNVI